MCSDDVEVGWGTYVTICIADDINYQRHFFYIFLKNIPVSFQTIQKLTLWICTKALSICFRGKLPVFWCNEKQSFSISHLDVMLQRNLALPMHDAVYFLENLHALHINMIAVNLGQLNLFYGVMHFIEFIVKKVNDFCMWGLRFTCFVQVWTVVNSYKKKNCRTLNDLQYGESNN